MAAKFPEPDFLQFHEIIEPEYDEKEQKDEIKVEFEKNSADRGNNGFWTVNQSCEQEKEIIIHRILKFIPIQTLFDLRLVSHLWNHSVMTYPHFIENTHIFVSNMRRRLHFKPLEEFDPSWKRIRIHKCENLLTMPELFLTELSKLELVLCPMEWKDLIILLSYTPNLEEFTFRKSLYFRRSRREEHPNYERYLAEISNFPNLRAIEVRVKHCKDAVFILNLVSKYSNRLNKVCFGCKSYASRLGGYADKLTEVTVKIMEKHSKTLEHFHAYLWDPNPAYVRRILSTEDPPAPTLLESFCLYTLQQILRCPLVLKNLIIYGGIIRKFPEQCIRNIKEFILTQQKSMENLTLPRIKYGMKSDFYDLLNSMPRTLKCLRVPSAYPPPHFLFYEFPNLHKFYLDCYDCGSADLNLVIPTEDQVILPHVKILSFMNHQDFTFSWICPSIRIKRITETFPFLTELIFRDTGKIRTIHIEDSDIQQICGCYPWLRKLDLSNCDCVTDFGLSGISDDECKRLLDYLKQKSDEEDEEDSIDDILEDEVGPDAGTKVGYSLESLESLQYLCLQDLEYNVTDISFYFGIRCPALRTIMLKGHPKITVHGIDKIFVNNPNLKHWIFKLNNGVVREYLDERERITARSRTYRQLRNRRGRGGRYEHHDGDADASEDATDDTRSIHDDIPSDDESEDDD